MSLNQWEAMFDRIRRWQDVQFPDATPHSTAQHLLKEAKELAKAPTDGEEAADILHMLLANERKAGYDLYEQVALKFAKNLNRKWGKPDSDGVVEHVSEG